MPPLPPEAAAVLRLPTTGHWDVPVITSAGPLHLLAFHATPPVFDGDEDLNGRRNHDEAAFWLRLLEGSLAMAAPVGPFVILGDANLDPADGDGRTDGIRRPAFEPRAAGPRPARQPWPGRTRPKG
jgi:hypothetical protein